MRTVEQEQVASMELALPASVQEALGELVNAAKDGLLALSVGVGLGVLAEMMETEVCEVVGPKGKRNPDRAAVRHGHEDGEITLGGRRVGVQRPRARTADGEREVSLATNAGVQDAAADAFRPSRSLRRRRRPGARLSRPSRAR